MKTYQVRYSTFITIEVEAEDEDLASMKADRVLNTLTGADFRENTDWDGIEEVEKELRSL